MTGDVARRETADQSLDRWRLPAVASIEIHHARYREPIRRYVSSGEVAEHFEASSSTSPRMVSCQCAQSRPCSTSAT